MDNQTTVSIKFTNNVTGQKKLEEYAETLKMINSFLSSIDIGKSSALEQAAKNTNNISSNETKDNIKDVSKSLKDIFGTSKIIVFSKVFGKVVKGMDVVDAIEKSKTTTVAYYQDVPVETIEILDAQVEA